MKYFITRLGVDISKVRYTYSFKPLVEGLYYDAETHFILGTFESAKLLGLMAWEWSTVQKGDHGYLIARSVIQ